LYGLAMGEVAQQLDYRGRVDHDVLYLRSAVGYVAVEDVDLLERQGGAVGGAADPKRDGCRKRATRR
jgi:hypothetical protein